jgi:dihydroceramide fatty acyl 2-hydroxylase
MSPIASGPLTAWQVIGAVVGGLFAWTLVEYVLHRYIFHLTGEHPWLKTLHFFVHGVHHEDANDPTRLVMPPAASLIIAGILYPIFRLALGDVWVNPFFVGIIIGYLIYEFTHFSVHFFKPKTKYGRYLKAYHMGHHFIDSESYWGVSTPLWDFVFGTAGKVRPKKKHSV